MERHEVEKAHSLWLRATRNRMAMERVHNAKLSLLLETEASLERAYRIAREAYDTKG